MTAAPFLMAAALISPIKRLIRSGFDFDIFDCYYFFPDGVAGALLSRYFGKPIVISALGTDLNLIPKYPLPKRMIQWAAREASGITAVCQALKDQLLELGVPDKSAKVVLHGVDLELFRPPQDREELRTRLELSRPTLLSVGHLIERKGHHLVIEALQFIPEAQLLIAGDGPEESPLKGLVRGLGLDSRVRFLGHLDQAKLRDYFGAADAMVLASSREGIANVLLESMACGTPVVATRVWGAPEVVTSPDAGALVSDRSAASIAQTIRALFERYPDRANTRRFVEQFSWSRTTNDHLRLFEEILKMGGDRATLASTV
jgi:glycosyltransferase involved in cell wall biosynthesis